MIYFFQNLHVIVRWVFFVFAEAWIYLWVYRSNNWNKHHCKQNLSSKSFSNCHDCHNRSNLEKLFWNFSFFREVSTHRIACLRYLNKIIIKSEYKHKNFFPTKWHYLDSAINPIYLNNQEFYWSFKGLNIIFLKR
jgi:hypothetical protein